LNRRDKLEDIGEDGRILLKRILQKYGGKEQTGFICRRRALVHTIMNLQVLLEAGSLLAS
jgi:hypothetical protein